MLNTKYVNEIFEESIKNEFEPHLNDIINDKSNVDNLWAPSEILGYLTFNTVYQAIFGKACKLKEDTQYIQLFGRKKYRYNK